jgi:protein phosphatase
MGDKGFGELSFGYASSIGMVRQRNEDSLCIRPDLGLWAVADGMGGYRSGDRASRMAVEQLARDVESSLTLSESISRIHRRILSEARADRELSTMGSTIVALKVFDRSYEVAWVGDSRAYLWNGHNLIRLTRDHSYVQFLVDHGRISEKEAERHPERNAITRALGAVGLETVAADTVHGSIGENEKILLCSDGLTGEVTDDAIAAVLAEESGPQAAVNRLVALANKQGGKDNISAILVSGDCPARRKKRGKSFLRRFISRKGKGGPCLL